MPDEQHHARDLLARYQVVGTPLYIIGAFDAGVTVLSQQVRALNFVWAATESNLLRSSSPQCPPQAPASRVAIIGCGFAGLTVAAGILAKRMAADITIFEQCDALLPLQEGSDSRWLHPRIYDWPSEGSSSNVAMLPVLNWTAGRASDVVVQILAEWKRLLTEHEKSFVAQEMKVFCNTRHLQVYEAATGDSLRVEWIGEERSKADGRRIAGQPQTARGQTRDFDLVVLAVGFGLERDGALSYWRNETIGQPSLNKPRLSYLLSGQGDGAMIDLLRLRVAQFRQDRILAELFEADRALLEKLKELHRKFSQALPQKGLFAEFESLEKDPRTKPGFDRVLNALERRLRRDTDVILRLKVRKLSELFEPETTRISFQNKLMVYLLYKCGGFTPSSLPEADLIQQYSIPPERVIRRHGTLRDEQIEAVLSFQLSSAVDKQRGSARPDPLSQTDRQRWPGGYFGFPGKSSDAYKLDDGVREQWRKEYLPAPTQMVATAFCSAIAGYIGLGHPPDARLRVALHRAMPFGAEELLQQACDYVGNASTPNLSGAGRTFPASNATIGLAYTTRAIVRTLRGVDRHILPEAMRSLQLAEASRQMSDKVTFILAIPLLEPELPGRFVAPTPVLGVLYVDSEAPGFFIEDESLRALVAMTQVFLERLERSGNLTLAGLSNVPLAEIEKVENGVPVAGTMSSKLDNALELVSSIRPPASSMPFQLNFDYSEFSARGG